MYKRQFIDVHSLIFTTRFDNNHITFKTFASGYLILTDSILYLFPLVYCFLPDVAISVQCPAYVVGLSSACDASVL